MSQSATQNLVLDLLEWLATRDRAYEEVMDAWRTSCPRLPVWEEANDQQLVMCVESDAHQMVRLTTTGRALIERQRPKSAPFR